MPPAKHNDGIIPLPQPLKHKIKDGIVAVSLANLCFVGVWYRLFSNLAFDFFNSIPVNQPTLLALLANILGLAAVFWLVLRAWRRWQNQWFHLIVHLLFFAVLLATMLVRLQMHMKASLISLLQQPAGVFVAAVVVALILWKHRWIARTAAILVAILSPLAIYTLAKIVFLSLGVFVHPPAPPDLFHPAPFRPVREGQPRVVWIIFDEADYRMIFAQRPAGLELPEFDRWLGESLSADNANSPTDSTVTSIPSLILGYRVSKAILTNSDDMAVQFVITNVTYWCSQRSSVFSSAREMGVNTAMVGWYLPYSKLFGKDLNYCSWRPFPIYQRTRALTFGAAMHQQIRCLTGTLQIRQDVVTMYQQSLAESLSLVTNQNYGLIFLHLFPPHYPGIYLRDKDRLTARKMDTVTGYFNNLALADQTLGKLSQALKASGEWDTTWFIVSADHSWRDSRVYDDQRDYRVPFLVNPPGPNGPVVYSGAFNTVATRSLIEAILRGEITNRTEAVADWLRLHAPARETVPGHLITSQ